MLFWLASMHQILSYKKSISMSERWLTMYYRNENAAFGRVKKNDMTVALLINVQHLLVPCRPAGACRWPQESRGTNAPAGPARLRCTVGSSLMETSADTQSPCWASQVQTPCLDLTRNLAVETHQQRDHVHKQQIFFKYFFSSVCWDSCFR